MRRGSLQPRRAGSAVAALLLLCAGCADGDPVASVDAQSLTTTPGEVVLSEDIIERIGLRAVAAEQGPLAETISVPGIIQYEERSLREFYAPVPGWVRKLSVRAAGERVAAGQLLFELYSAQLAPIDRDYLESLAAGTVDGDDNPYVRGLRALGLTDELIGAVKTKERAPGTIPFRAPSSGLVTQLNFREDALVTVGASVMQFVRFDPVWLIAEVPAADVGRIAPGTHAMVTVPAYPDRAFEGKVGYIYSDLNPRNRTVRVRVVIPNPDRLLKQDMYATARLHPAPGEPVVHIPLEALIRGGQTDRVIVATEEGRFAAREVKAGREAGGRVAILAGLAPGEHVVSSAVFLIDSEANLRSSLARLGGETSPAPAGEHHHHHHSGAP